VREQLDRYGISAALGPGAYYDTPGEALEAFHATEQVIGEQTAQRDSAAVNNEPGQ
jgi:hypothetical protein